MLDDHFHLRISTLAGDGALGGILPPLKFTIPLSPTHLPPGHRR